MCDIAKALSRAFTPAGTGGLEAALASQQAAADASAKTASDALTAALKSAQAAAVPAIDNPSAKLAGLDQMKALMAMQGAAWSFQGTPTAAPMVGTKVLMGA